ncbi:MAG: hypothetical protein HIU88_10305 [Acidobacteria bacterium]|nr:hypothetical protein [Acidobacteriota bacterium]
MGARETSLKRITTLNKQLKAHDEKRKVMMLEREEEIRVAAADRATWDEIQATGVSRATIAKALGKQ